GGGAATIAGLAMSVHGSDACYLSCDRQRQPADSTFAHCRYSLLFRWAGNGCDRRPSFDHRWEEGGHFETAAREFRTDCRARIRGCYMERELLIGCGCS